LFGRLREKREVEQAAQITKGAPLPEVEVDVLLFATGGENETTTSNVPAAVLPVSQALGNGTTLLVGMPGAFTPTCTDQHLPGFVRSAGKLKQLGVSRIAVLTTNDRFVNSAWNQNLEACMQQKSTLLMLSDADGDLVKSLGLIEDMGFGIGARSKRFVIVATDGVVDEVLVDEGMNDLENTSAESVVSLLTPKPADPSPRTSLDSEPGPLVALGVLAAWFAAFVLFGDQAPQV